jgi:hypothetical protein
MNVIKTACAAVLVAAIGACTATQIAIANALTSAGGAVCEVVFQAEDPTLEPLCVTLEDVVIALENVIPVADAGPAQVSAASQRAAVYAYLLKMHPDAGAYSKK